MNLAQPPHHRSTLSTKKPSTQPYQALNANDQNGLAGAVHDISQGGVWQALVEMVGGDRNWPLVGLDITLPADQDPVTFLFSESGGYIVEVASEHTNAFETLVAEHVA